MIDLKGFLESMGIDYKEHGKNVGTNDINVCCPFCGEDSAHLGINKINGLIHCWACKFEGEDRRPTLVKLIMELCGLSYEAVVSEIKIYSYADFEESGPVVRAKIVRLPEEAEDFIDTRYTIQRDFALRYLFSRGFGRSHINKHGLKFCPIGDYARRIIVPIYFGGALVTFLGRDYTGRSSLPYNNCPVAESVMSPKQLLYGLDDFMGTHARLVEGFTDRMRIGYTALAVLTNKASREQRGLLISLGLKSLSIILDPGALLNAHTTAGDLSPFIPKIRVVELSAGDVASHTIHELLAIEEGFNWLKF